MNSLLNKKSNQVQISAIAIYAVRNFKERTFCDTYIFANDNLNGTHLSQDLKIGSFVSIAKLHLSANKSLLNTLTHMKNNCEFLT